ncbi:MAG: OmpH family outer membrane protein, partial [FCB group bacterium]
MKSFFVFITGLIFALSFNQSAFAQKGEKAVNIGVVDVETIVKELPEAVAADKLLKDITQKYRDTLMLFQKEYSDKIDAYDKQKSMMTADQQKKEQDAMKAIEIKFQKFQEDK